MVGFGGNTKNGKIHFKDFDEDDDEEEKDVQVAIIDTGFQGNLVIPKNNFELLDAKPILGEFESLVDANKKKSVHEIFSIPIKIKNKLFNTDVVFTDGKFLVSSSFLNEYFDSMHAKKIFPNEN